ncbi:MAG: hypothetical protein ABIX01_07315 [Chitinophagaceae bacterium]
MKIFRFLLIVCLPLIYTCLHAQMKDEQLNRLRQNVQVFLEDKDADFASNTIPAAWEEQSAVIIAQKTAMFFDQKTSFKLFGKSERKVIIQEKERRKIKLLDNNAVEAFSELYFDVTDIENGFDGKVIKTDGKEEKLDLTRAIAVEDNADVPGLFRSYTQSGGKRFFKVPVNGLQPGDILDYAYLANNDASVRDSYLEFLPVYYQCHRPYSTMKQAFEIKLDRNTFLCSKSMNGAPEFLEKEQGEFNIYSWEDRNREKLKDQNFVNEYLLLPMMKFQIVFSSKENAANLFIGNRGELKTNFTPEEFGKKLGTMYATNSSGYNNGLLSQVKYHLKKMDAYGIKDDEFIKDCYYTIRHVCLMNDIEIGSGSFAWIFKKLMDEPKIPCSIMVTAANNLTALKDVIFRSEIEWFVRAKDKYVFSSNNMSNLYDIPPYVQGNTAYSLVLGKVATIENATLPIVNYANNSSDYILDASLDLATENITVTSNQEYKGNSRDREINNALMYENFLPLDWKTYGGYDELDELPEIRRDALNERILRYRKEGQRLKPLYMEKQLKGEYPDVVKYNAFRLLQDGRSFKKSELRYAEDFLLGDFVRHAGKSLLVSIPSLVSSQLQVKGEERTRQYDIDVRFARQIKWTINFAIPAGYKVLGLEDLQNNIENETGGFVSTAILQPGKLVIVATKTYKQPRISKANWGAMLQWLDAAYNFSQKKILLRKG